MDMKAKELKAVMSLPAASVDRYSIIRLPNGQVGVWERKTMTCIISWGKYGIKVKGDTVVEVIKPISHLAADFLETIEQ